MNPYPQELEGLDATIGQPPAASRRPHQHVCESICTPARPCLLPRLIKRCHAGILRISQKFSTS